MDLDSNGKEYQEIGNFNNSKTMERVIAFNDREANAVQEFPSNTVITSKYTIWNFLPKFLFESFKKVANAYFLVVTVLQCVKVISNTNGVPSNAPALIFILTVDGILAIIEDRRRHIADSECNAAICHCLESPKGDISKTICRDKAWSELQVGEIVQLRNRETAPADLVILTVSEPDATSVNGICYVETKSLDGETNLKLRQAMESTMNTRTEAEAASLQGIMTCETPNKSIGRFSGVYKPNPLSEEEAYPVSLKNVILRGCQLRNTEWVFGLVVNTGPDTKIMQSATAAPSKWSAINTIVNKMIFVLILFLFVCCLVATTCQVIWNEQNSQAVHTYLQWSPDAVSQWFLGFGYYFLVMYQIIPVSLYVSVSFVMFFQSTFMTWDLDMYYEPTDTRANVRTMTLNEELGQVSYIFSDKTGTLTCNIMDFRKCSINGVSYGKGTTEIGRAAAKRAGIPISDSPLSTEMEVDMEKKIPFVNFYDPAMTDALNGVYGELQQQKIEEFLTHLAVCHTVIPEKIEGTSDIRLSASSPDEQALVAGAIFFGYKFESRGVGIVRIRVKGILMEYNVLEVLEFNSDRKRMSVILKSPSGDIIMYTKGADSTIFPRLSEESDHLMHTTEAHMKTYANEGLRTLVLTRKDIDFHEFTSWSKRYKTALSDMREIEKRKNNKPNSIDDLMDEIETRLDLLGATGIEDKLQKDVPLTIARLAEANIKIWVLTGDKQETAINIAFACQLIDNTMQQFIVNLDDYPGRNDLRDMFIESIDEINQNVDRYSLIIDGDALEYALEAECAPFFVSFANRCDAVVCCRVSPSQKAEVIKLVKQYTPEARTLAIGDGANDVAMIQVAHIGVGISGQEGLQAVNSSDYAIAQFSFLQKLLLHHGRLNYSRMCKLIGYVFYKNILLVLAQYYFTYFTGSSGQKIYNELGFQCYNILYTAMCIVYVGVFDYDVPAFVSFRYPKIYECGQKHELFNARVFLQWTIAAVYESLIIFHLTVTSYNNLTSSVGNADLLQYGLVAFTLVVMVSNFKLFILVDAWDYFSGAIWIFGIISWLPITILISSYWLSLFTFDFGSFQNTLNTPAFWFVIPVAIFVSLGRYFGWTAYRRMTRPNYREIVQEKYVLSQITEESLSESEEVHDEEEGYSRKTKKQFEDSIEGGTAFSSMSTPPSLNAPNRDLTEGNIQSHDRTTFPILPKKKESLLGRSHSTVDSKCSSPSIRLERKSEGMKDDRRRSLRRESTGYAFSFDPQTTVAESYLVSNAFGSASMSINAAVERSHVCRDKKKCTHYVVFT